MKRQTILISSAAALALGLSAWAVLGPDRSEESGSAAAEDDAARFSSRPASAVGGPRSGNNSLRPTGPVKLTDRSAPRPAEQTKAGENLRRLLTPAQLASVTAARRNAASLPPGLARKQPRVTPARQQAIAKMQEDLRTAVKTDPDRWIETYDSLNREFNQRNGGYNGGGGFPGTSPDPVDPSEPSTPEPTEPSDPTPVDPVDPVDPGEEAPDLPLPLDETQRLAEEYRAEQGKYLDGPSDRDSRFKGNAQ